MAMLAALLVALPIAWLAVECRTLRLALMTPAEDPTLDELIGCLHPADARTDHSTSGTRRWTCDLKKGGCGHQHEEPMRAVSHG